MRIEDYIQENRKAKEYKELIQKIGTKIMEMVENGNKRNIRI